MAKRTCSVDGCDRPHNANGLCQTHEKRLKKYGTTDAPPEKPRPCGHERTPENTLVDKAGKKRCKPCREAYIATHVSDRTCSAPGCDRPVLANDLCKRDYQRMKFKGSTEDRVLMTPEERQQSQRDASNRWNAANRDLVRQRSREFYQNNREAELERRRIYTAANPEKISAYNKRWTLENPGRRTELWRAWVKANPIRARAIGNAHRARRQKWLRETSDGPIDYEGILAEFGMTCHICGGEIESISGKVLHFDHVIPREHGGRNIRENIRPAHAKCNQQKSNKLLEEYLAQTEPEGGSL